MDNLEPTSVDNSSPEVESNAVETSANSASVSWKESLGTDIKNSPLLGKFEDTPEGLNKAFESHASLEQMLGHDKVPIPKSADDVEGWNRFSKAMGIPDKAEGYGLADSVMPESMKGLSIDKNQFAEVAHAHKLTPDQTKGLWKVYNEINIEAYGKAMEEHQKTLNDVINTLRGEWGDAFDTNVELGQTVINKFSADQDANDWLTATLTKHPAGIKFLAKIGDQFAESKLGEFQMKKFSLDPEEAREEALKMSRDLSGPYMNTEDKFTKKEHDAAVDRYNSLLNTANRGRG